jgi:dephospho-CoA kinase
VVGLRIALTGKMRSGKDTVAEHLVVSYGFERQAFGDALKLHAHATLPWIAADPKPRALYQQFGQLMREIEPDVWVRHVERQLSDKPVVISDLRQPNEHEWARKNGFTIVRVTTPDDIRIKRMIDAGDDFTAHDITHETELSIDGFTVDYELVNDGKVGELLAKVDAIMEAI